MAQPVIADMPRDVDLTGDYIIRITALNQSTGATVSGVTVSDVVITARNVLTGEIVSISADTNPYLVPTTESG